MRSERLTFRLGSQTREIGSSNAADNQFITVVKPLLQPASEPHNRSNSEVFTEGNMTQQFVKRLINPALLLCALTFLSTAAFAQYPIGHVSDMKPSSVLFFNRYTSNPSNPAMGDTQINITNTSQNSSAALHLFLVDGSTCGIADLGLSLTPNQTISFLMSDFDPGVQGYAVCVATDGSTPTQFNFLVGTAYVRETDGRQAILQAIGFAKKSPGPIEAKLDGSFSLLFNGVDYEQLPTQLAVSSFNSQATETSNLIIYSPSANLTIGAVDTVNVFTLIYDDAEKSISSSFSVRCYRNTSFTALFNRGGGINSRVPAGRTGWIRLNATSRPILGSVITRGPVFQGGYNLHALSLLSSYEITLPVF